MIDSYSGVGSALLNSTSDKESLNIHRYGILYDLIFDALLLRQGRNIRICEIGVSLFGGGSLEAFQNLDVVDIVVGIDHRSWTGTLSDKAKFYLMNAYTHKTINSLKKWHNSFDIIIDDGSHKTIHQEFFLTYYCDLLSEGGLLICEDVLDDDLFSRYSKKTDCYGFDLSENIDRNIPDERILLKFNTNSKGRNYNNANSVFYPEPVLS